MASYPSTSLSASLIKHCRTVGAQGSPYGKTWDWQSLPAHMCIKLQALHKTNLVKICTDCSCFRAVGQSTSLCFCDIIFSVQVRWVQSNFSLKLIIFVTHVNFSLQHLKDLLIFFHTGYSGTFLVSCHLKTTVPHRSTSECHLTSPTDPECSQARFVFNKYIANVLKV